MLHIIRVSAQLPLSSPVDGMILLSSYSQNFVNVFCVPLNPSAAEQLTQLEIGLRLERKFGMAELDQYTICAALPTKLGAFGLHVNQFGYDGYHQTQAALTFAKGLGKVNMGIQFGYEGITLNGYDHFSRFSADVGSTWHLTDKLRAGLNTNLIFSRQTAHQIKSIRVAYSTGIAYEISANVLAGIVIISDEEQPANMNAGIHYQFAGQFYAGIGISTQPVEFHLCAGWKWNSLIIQVLTTYHFQLGLSPGFSLLYQSRKKK